MANEVGKANAKAAGVEYEGYVLQNYINDTGSLNLTDSSASGKILENDYTGNTEGDGERASKWAALEDALKVIRNNRKELK